MDDTQIVISLHQSIMQGTDTSCNVFKHEIDKLFKHKQTVTITNKGWFPTQKAQWTKQEWLNHWKQ
jgi:hypothetical protein